jgi:small subunit ribosomal protein S7
MAEKLTASYWQLKPDGKYGSKLAAKFINCMMHKGKKSVSQGVFYDAMDIIGKKVKDAEPLKVFEMAINNVKPVMEVRSKRVGGSSYQVPMPVNSRRQQSLAMRWVIEAARAKKGQAMSTRLATELIDAYNKQGGAMTTRENVHKMAEANKAFAHFAW